MYFAAVALVGASFGQPPVVPPATPTVQEYQEPKFLANRQIKLPIKYEKDKNLRQVLLYVARNGENTWYQAAAMPPGRDSFTYVAVDDGVYWFTMVEEDLQGRRDPADITRTPPDQKVIVDTVKPRIQFTHGKRVGEMIAIEWIVEDKYPNENMTKVQFKTVSAPENAWLTVSLPPISKSGVGFSAGTTEPIMVRVTAYDMALNKTEAIYPFGPGVANSPASTSTAPAAPTNGVPLPPASPPAPPVVPSPSPVIPGPVTPQYPIAAVAPTPDAHTVVPVAPPAPPNVPNVPVAPPSVPVMPQLPVSPPGQSQTQAFGMPAVQSPVTPPAPVVPQNWEKLGPSTVATNPIAPLPPMVPSSPGVLATSVPSTTPGIGSGAGNTQPTQSLPVFDPRQAVVPAVPLGNGSGGSPTPVAVWTGPPTTAPTVEITRANVINYLTFEMGYELESHGPSGISHVDLWVTRDDGRSWLKWSQHDGKGTSLRVNLNVPANPQPEGTYGFRVVPVSGAGLSEREPAPGDTPDLRVVVDITPPQLDLFPPVNDPANTDTLIIQWKATDKNFTDEPITIEWSDKPTGPWQPVATGGDIVQAVAGTTPILRKLPNTGQYAWRVPAGLSPRVYLKVCARDAAGNVREVITRDPILVDLVKPRAKISGIVPPPAFPLPRQ